MTSERPATSFQVTVELDREAGRWVFTLGVSFTTRQRKYTIRHIKTSGSQIRSIPPTSSRDRAHDQRIGSRGQKP